MNERVGLIRARMTGAHMARGDVIMFQDAHTEANVGWAEPLLQAIQDDPTTVIQVASTIRCHDTTYVKVH